MKELETLRELGLTEYEAKVALALLQFGPCVVKELYAKSHVPKNKIYESLESLSNKGIVEILPITPRRYLIKSFDSFVCLLNAKEESLKNLKQQLDNLRKIKKFPLSTKEPVWLVYGHHCFLSKLKEVMSNVSKENFVLAKKARADPTLLRLTKEALERGVKVRILFQGTKNPVIKKWSKIGVKVRYLPESSGITFSTFDNFICRVNLEIETANESTLWIESPAFINILRARFEQLWKIAHDSPL